MLVQIDTRSISENFFMDQEQINDLMDYSIKELTARFAQEWENEAARTLGASRAEYISNITVVDEGVAKGAVVLTGWLPNAVEQGTEAHDMKEDFLNGSNAKTGKNGNRFNTIPFKHGAPDSLVENFNGGIMPPEIHAIAKSKPLKSPILSGELPKEYSQPRTHELKRESKTFAEYQHKSSIYEGISKRKDSVTGQNSYISFRRVSDSSDPNSWWNNGIEAKHIADKVLNSFDVPREMSRILDNYLGA